MFAETLHIINDITWGEIYDNLLDLDSVMDGVHRRLHGCKHF